MKNEWLDQGVWFDNHEVRQICNNAYLGQSLLGISWIHRASIGEKGEGQTISFQVSWFVSEEKSPSSYDSPQKREVLVCMTCLGRERRIEERMVAGQRLISELFPVSFRSKQGTIRTSCSEPLHCFTLSNIFTWSFSLQTPLWLNYNHLVICLHFVSSKALSSDKAPFWGYLTWVVGWNSICKLW